MAVTFPAPRTIPDPPPSRRRRIRRRSLLALILAAWSKAGRARLELRARLRAGRADQSGNVITDNLAWIVFGVVIIVGIAALVTNLGSDVFTYVQKQLGV